MLRNLKLKLTKIKCRQVVAAASNQRGESSSARTPTPRLHCKSTPPNPKNQVSDFGFSKLLIDSQILKINFTKFD